jgi:hypothetical protein
VTSIEPGSHFRRDEELGPVGVLPGIRHGQPAGAKMLQLEVLILEPFSVDASPAGSVTSGEISALYHEVLDDSVENGPFVSLSLGFLGQLFEVLRSFWNGFPEESDFDPSSWLSANRDIEPNLEGEKEYFFSIFVYLFIFPFNIAKGNFSLVRISEQERSRLKVET